MSLRYLAGFITASYNPLKVPNAPTIGTVTAGNAQVSVAFTAPSNVGGGAITSYIVLVQNTSTGVAVTGTGSASPIVVTGLTNGQTYTAQVAAVNTYGPSAYSSPSGSFSYAPKLYSWGQNTNGQLGQNDRVDRSSPVQVGALTNWSIIAVGVNSTAAVKTDGTLWGWGWNDAGQLGSGDTISRSSPVQIGALTTWSKVAKGGYQTLAIKTDGTLWSWGDGTSGQLGSGTTYSASSPVQVGALTTWTTVAGVGGGPSSYGIKTDGTLWSWGGGSFGLLGQNSVSNKLSPVQVGLLTNWSKLAGSLQSISAVKTDGTLWSWGRNVYGTLGDNTTYNASSPIQIGALTTWLSVGAGGYHVGAIKADGTLWTWGNNTYGQLGQNNRVNRSSPVQVGSLATWSYITGPLWATLAIKTDGTLWSWGSNDNAVLGLNIGTNNYRSSPVQVGALTTWLNVAAKNGFVLATSN